MNNRLTSSNDPTFVSIENVSIDRTPVKVSSPIEGRGLMASVGVVANINNRRLTDLWRVWNVLVWLGGPFRVCSFILQLQDWLVMNTRCL